MISNASWEIPVIKYSPYELSLANIVGSELAKHRQGAASSRVLKETSHSQGFLGEYMYFAFMHDIEGINLGWQAWFKTEYGDKYDFLIDIASGRYTLDVKTRSCEGIYGDILDYEVILDDPEKGNQISKGNDFYQFAVWDKRAEEVHLLGWQGLDDFFRAPSARVVQKGERIWDGSDYTANERIYLLQVRDLNSTRSILSA